MHYCLLPVDDPTKDIVATNLPVGHGAGRNRRLAYSLVSHGCWMPLNAKMPIIW
jgi:hypothetical protein